MREKIGWILLIISAGLWLHLGPKVLQFTRQRPDVVANGPEALFSYIIYFVLLFCILGIPPAVAIRLLSRSEHDSRRGYQ